ncbi:MAG TPA: SDR family oxidoreductase [Gemmatimonadales bacterium]|jgi:3-oxoacyl-[acyl-carrier protein] reductase|nr:SDR family oxidoreductase [Gemmatimonadales bacterium]
MPQIGTALVTGATEGIGRATALALGSAGWRIGVCARTPARVAAIVAELRRSGIEAAGRPGDAGVEADAHAVVAEVARTLGPVDALINNAGVMIAKPLEELTPDDWDRTMATNVRSLFLMSRAVLPEMRRRRRGAIVNVASLSGRTGFAGGTAYCASKHAVLGFSRALMQEVRRDRIRVIAVCPGSVDTSMLRDQPMLQTDPARILRAEDVAATIVHALALPERALVSELDIRPTNP